MMYGYAVCIVPSLRLALCYAVFSTLHAASLLLFTPTDVLSLLLFIAKKIYITYRLNVLDKSCPSMDDMK